MRRSGGSSGSSNKPRYKMICTDFVYGQCLRSAADCRFDHPRDLANALVGRGDAVANASFNRSSNSTSFRPLSSRPLSPSSSHTPPPSPSCPGSPRKSSFRSVVEKRPGSPAPSRKIQFGKVYLASIEGEQNEEQKHQQQEQWGYSGSLH